MLITSELTTQSARKALYSLVWYILILNICLRTLSVPRNAQFSAQNRLYRVIWEQRWLRMEKINSVGLQTMVNLKNLGYIFQDAQTGTKDLKSISY